MESKPFLRTPERREDKDSDREFDALEKAALDPSLRRSSFWADAFRDLAFEGSSSEERLRERARRVEQSWRNRNELAEPDVIPLPNFDETPPEESSIVVQTTSSVSDVEKTQCAAVRPTNSKRRAFSKFATRFLKIKKSKNRARKATFKKTSKRPAPEKEDAESCVSAPRSNDRLSRLDVETDALRKRSFCAALIETLLCPPCGACAWAFLWLASKERAREEYGAAVRHEAKAQGILYVGKALILTAIFFLAASMIVVLLSGD